MARYLAQDIQNFNGTRQTFLILGRASVERYNTATVAWIRHEYHS
jgi:hypothetical protein